jgi:tRNA uridine 5-carboxymethylaminomethyl modification enzyme
MAGLNAARRAAGVEPDRVLSRGEAYVGVLVDDLVLQGVSEPYRMLTARAEHRLSLRADNAGLRLTARGLAWGCIGPERARRHASFATQVADALERARSDALTSTALRAAGVAVRADGQRRTALEVLALPEVETGDAMRAFPWLQNLAAPVLAQLEAEALYAPYLARHAQERALLAREEAIALPEPLDYQAIPGLSREMQDRLGRARPSTLGAAARVAGITPAALAALATHLRRSARA